MARYPLYAPDFRIKIDGDKIPATLRAAIASISYQDGIEGADRVEVTIANDNLRWLDHPLLQPDNGFTLSLGYAPDPLEEVFVGEITGVEPTFPNSGMPTIKIVAHDFLQRLTKGKKDRGFVLNIPSIGVRALPDPVIAALISAENLLIPSTDPIGGVLSVLLTVAALSAVPSEAQKDAARQKTSDFSYLTEIAKRNGFEMYIDHTVEPRGYVLKFRFLMSDFSPSLTLKWGSSLMNFTPRLTTVGDIAGVTARIWIASLKIALNVIVSWDFDRATFNLKVFPGFDDLTKLIESGDEKAISISGTSPANSIEKILSELLPRLNNRLTGSGGTIGDLRIKAGRVINLENLGEQFSGLYRITSATHTLDGSGLRTSFQVRKEVWFGSIPIPRSASGLLRVQGQSVGAGVSGSVGGSLQIGR
ncbi:MAG: hypothetical protein WCB68_17000 [Pyrinomonadaceae bacterium]